MEQKVVKVTTTRGELRRKIILFSISSRIFVLALSFASNATLPDHDAGVYSYPRPQENNTWLDNVVDVVFGGLARWDAQYFLHIAHYGYTYENTLAFFPFFPVLTRVVAQVLALLTGSLINSVSTTLVSSILVNFVLFIKATITLFDLSCKVLQDDKLAFVSALFFCINPASVFFTAPYSESCFAFFTFSGMLFCMDNTKLLTSMVFGLSGCVRSNGIVSFGFIAHKTLKNILDCTFTSKSLFLGFFNSFCESMKFCINAVIFLLPFVMFQLYTYFTYCFKEIEMPIIVKEFGFSNKFVMPGSPKSKWCNNSIPFSYSYVQNHYWNVGFLKYYELKQIPNFLLALPIVYLVLSQSYAFLVQNKTYLVSLGLRKAEFVKCQERRLRCEFFIFVIHALFLVIFCVLFIHVQVTTRMLASSSPVMYWFIAFKYKTINSSVQKVISSRLHSVQRAHKYSYVETEDSLNSWWKTYVFTDSPADRWSYFVRLYFCSYLVAGTILFSNFYPWT